MSTETSLNIEDDDRGKHEVLGPQNGNVVINGGSSSSRNRRSTLLRITEGTTKSLTFELSVKPGGSVTLTIAEWSEVGNFRGVPIPSANPTTLTFTPMNWNMAQTVEFEVEDDEKELVKCRSVTYPDNWGNQGDFNINVSSDDTRYKPAAVVIFGYDDDDDRCDSENYPHDAPAGITVPSTKTATEGNTTVVDVKLRAPPPNDVKVTFSDDGNSDLTWSGTTLSGDVLTFTSNNWDQAQTVTLTAEEDGDVADDTETLTLTASDGSYEQTSGNVTVTTPSDYPGKTAEITVTITDNDVRGITVPGVATVTEESTTTVDVKLTAEPSGTVTVMFSNDGDSDVSWSGTTLSGNALTFTTSNWNEAQTVTLTAGQDDDFANDTETLTLTASKTGGYNGETAEIAVTITDNDAAGITVSSTAAVTEGSTTTVDVKLAAKPSGDVTVTFEDDGDSDVFWSDTPLGGAVLKFTAENWNVAQTVTLNAKDDDDFEDDTVTLTLRASKSGGYNEETAEITVTITDNDAAGITVPGTVTVTEGGSTTVDVKLAAPPVDNTKVTFSDDGDSDVSWSGTKLSGDALTFTDTNWNVAQTVTLTAAEDDDSKNDTETLTLTVSKNGETANITVTVTDDDAAAITVPGKVTVTEGSTTTMDVELAAKPSATVTVTFSDDGNSDVTWSGTTLSGDALTFTTVNWNVAQTVTLTAADDDDFVNDTETLTLTASNGGYNGKTAEITVTVTDNDAAGITVPGTAAVTEASTTTVDVKLAAEPSGTVTVTFSDDGDSDVSWSGTTLSGDALTFTAGNWSKAQTVTLTAAADDDFVNDSETLTLTAANGGYNGKTANIKVTITDDDTAGITVPGKVTVTEGSTMTVDVKLAAAPTESMTVTLDDDGDSDVTWSGADFTEDALTLGAATEDAPTLGALIFNVLTFTPTNWNEAQTVTLKAAEDDDFVNDTEILTLTASGGGHNGETAEITVSVTDDDEAGITASSTATMTEGSSTTVDVKLAAAPTGNMTVTFSDDGDSDVSWSGTTLSGNALTFTNANWNVAQTVTLTAGQDDDFANDTETLTLTAANGSYNGETVKITVTITDDDEAGIVVQGTATITEGSSTTVDVKLAATPTGNVLVKFSDDGDSDVSLSGARLLSGGVLVFGPGDWNKAQTVTLTAEEDDDFINDTEILTLRATAGGYNGETANITVTIEDDGMGIVVPGTATVTEENTTTVDVKLSALPTGTVTVTFSNDGDSDVSWSGTALSGDALTFSTTNWSQAQTVTLTAAADNDFVNDTEILTLTASKSGGYNGETAEITVTITDNDTAGIAVPNAATVTEGNTTTVDVKLAVAPTANMTVTLSNDGNSDVSWSGTTLSGDALTFTDTNWSTAQTVTLTAEEDDDFVNDTEILTLTASKSGGYNGETAKITVTITDNDAAGITAPSTATVSEASTTTVDVKLAATPTGNVLVTLSDDGDSDVSWSGTTLSGDALTFTTANWNVAQTVTLTAAEDGDFANDTEILTLTASKSGGYNGEVANILVTVTDNDMAGITVPGTVAMTEGGTTTVDVKLAVAPTGNVTVTLSDDGDRDVRWSGAALTGDFLTFTPQNWDLAQTVTLTVAEDDDFVNDTETLTLTASKSGGYNGETAEITVTVTDNDAAGIEVLGTATVTEGNTTTVDVKLAAAPTASMTVTLSDDGDSDVSWSGAALTGDVLTFIPQNWDLAQTVTLTAGQDDDFVNDTEILTLTASKSGGYNGEAANVAVTIEDDDTAGITVPSTATVIEASTTTVDVKLAAAPTASMTVTLSDDGDSDVSWSGAALTGDVLTFTPQNWHLAQTVTLTAEEDDDFANHAETLTLTASKSGGYNGETAEITVTIEDDDVPGITVPPVVSLIEGSITTVEVNLAAVPTAEVTVTFSDDGDSDLTWSGTTLSGDALTFTATNWNVAQAVTLTAGQDEDFANDTETLTLTTSKSGGYNGEAANVAVTITDNNVSGIAALPEVSLTEGSTTTSEVRLATAPTANVAVTLSDDGDSDVSWSGTTLSGDALTFTTTNWNVAQTVTLTAGQDDDFVDDTEILTLTASKSGGYNGETVEITVTIDDNDVPGITVSGTATVTEGSTTTVEVKLAATPTGEVAVTLSDDGDSDVSWSGTTLSGDVLTFTTTNWNVAQVVTLTAEDDDDFENGTVELNLTASGGGYDGVTADITVTIDDNDVDGGGITVPNAATMTEGSTTTVEMKLAAAPKDDVTVTLSDDGDSDVSWSGTTLSGDVLTFTTTNWNVAQTVTLMAAEDDDFVNDTEILTLTASTSGGYSGETAEITVTITDNDAPGIAVSSTEVTVTEGGGFSVEVTLATAPKGNVVIICSDDGDSDMHWSGTTLSGDALTFTTANWNIGQTVMLMAAEDDDFVNDTEILTLTASKSGGYNGETTEIMVTIDDNDVDGARITVPSTLTVTEGSTMILDVKLAAAPTGDVAVIFSDDGDSDLTWSGTALSGDTLTFDTTNWNVAQAVALTAAETVTLKVAEDDDFWDDTEILMLTASGGGYDGVVAAITVTIMSNESLDISESELLQEVTLLGNYPNPLSDVANIEFDLPVPAQILVVITDMLGRTVKTLPYGWLEAGQAHTIKIDTARLTSGMYYYTLRVDMEGKVVQRSKSMTIVR